MAQSAGGIVGRARLRCEPAGEHLPFVPRARLGRQGFPSLYDMSRSWLLNVERRVHVGPHTVGQNALFIPSRLETLTPGKGNRSAPGLVLVWLHRPTDPPICLLLHEILCDQRSQVALLPACRRERCHVVPAAADSMVSIGGLNTGDPGVVGALILIPIAIVCGITFVAIKTSEVCAAKWVRFQNFLRLKRAQRHRRNRSDPPAGPTRRSGPFTRLESVRASLRDEVERP